MDRPPTPLKTPELYSTVVIHSDKENDRLKREEKPQLDEDDDSVHTLLKWLPKNFGGDGGSFFNYDHESSSAATAGGNDFSTVIVKPSTPRFAAKPPLAGCDPSYSEFYNSGRLKRRIETFDEDNDEDNGDFSTFVVKNMGKQGEDVSGTVVRRTA